MSKKQAFNGDVVAEAMDSKGLSDTSLGALIGVSSRSVANYRAGSEPRGYATLCDLASALGLQVDDLFRKVTT